MKNILIIVGSLRKGSFNLQMSKLIEDMIKDKVQISRLEFADVPFFNQDTEFPTPPAVARVREEVMKADGIWICSPEYNSKLPAVLKNLIDWLSRPMKQDDPNRATAVAGKIVTYSSVGGHRSGFGARSALADILSELNMVIVGNEGTGISFNAQDFKSGVMTFDDYEKNELKTQVQTFLKSFNIDL